MKRNIATKCIHLEKERTCEHTGAISFPIYQTATFAHKEVGESTGYDYTRLQNPTREHLEEVVAALEKGVDALAFSSGMAAISTLMELFNPTDHIIIDEDLYGGSVRLFEHICKKNGILFTRVNCSEESIEPYVMDNTKAVFLETPTNPMMNVSDIVKISKITKKYNILLIIDNTFLSPYFQNPLQLGADVVVHSGTKYLGGHNDTLAGFLVTSHQWIGEKLRFIAKTTGAALAPFDCWLILRGIKTLAVRMEKAQENAIALANWFSTQKQVTNVIYPGLQTHKGYEIMKKQSRGFGAMITIEVKTREIAHFILKNVKLIQFAESLGGVETLITYPITQTHADVSKEELEQRGITEKILRISVGIEAVEDLIFELENVFGQCNV